MLNEILNLLHEHMPQNELGQDLAEYALFIGLIAIVVVVSMTIIGSGISNVIASIATAIQNML